MGNSIETITPPDPIDRKRKLMEESKKPEIQSEMWRSLLEYKRELIKSLEENNYPDSKDWRECPENRLRIPNYGRNMTSIADMFGMTKKELLEKMRGKKVLNVGPGSSTFATESGKESDCEVFSIDIDEEVLKSHYQPKKFIIGDASKMGIRDESFDMVFSTVSMPYYASSKEQAQDFFREAIRVLKIGGQAFVSPFTSIDIRLNILEVKKELIEIQIGVIDIIEEMLQENKVEVRLIRRIDPEITLPHSIIMKKVK